MQNLSNSAVSGKLAIHLCQYYTFLANLMTCLDLIRDPNDLIHDLTARGLSRGHELVIGTGAKNNSVTEKEEKREHQKRAF